MCASYEAKYQKEDMSRVFGVQPPLFEFPFLFYPKLDVPIIRVQNGSREMLPARWGIIPHWAKDPGAFKAATFNARAETLEHKASYRDAYRKGQRCLLPVSQFYEWHTGEDGHKTKYAIGLADAELFAFAGLWEHNTHGALMPESCTLITTHPNALMAKIHNRRPRMPLMVRAEDYDQWLDPEVALSPESLKAFEAEEMWAREVDT